MRGTLVLSVRSFKDPFKGVWTHSTLSRMWMTSSYNTKPCQHLKIHIPEVLQKEFSKSNERNKSYSNTPSRKCRTHSTLFRIWTTLSYNTNSWYNLPKYVPEVLQKKFWKTNERNMSYSRLNLPIPLQGGGSAHPQSFPESQGLWVTSWNLNTISTYIYRRYRKRNFENRIRGTWVIHVRTFKDPFKGGSEHTQRFAKSERLRVKPPNHNTILTIT
jgi:hypothetical protein